MLSTAPCWMLSACRLIILGAIGVMNLINTMGTLAVSLGLGSLAGYCVFLYAKADGMLNITVFHYPVIQAVILAVTVTVIQLLLTYGVLGASGG